jgi:hypothetical protein
MGHLEKSPSMLLESEFQFRDPRGGARLVGTLGTDGPESPQPADAGQKRGEFETFGSVHEVNPASDANPGVE